LEKIGLVIFDEFHERNIHADVALAFCRESQAILRPDLRIIVMSATMDMLQLSKLLSAPVEESQGSQYPVAIHYTQDVDERMVAELTAQPVKEAARFHSEVFLWFLQVQGRSSSARVY